MVGSEPVSTSGRDALPKVLTHDGAARRQRASDSGELSPVLTRPRTFAPDGFPSPLTTVRHRRVKGYRSL